MGKMFKYFGIVALLLMLARPPQAAASDDGSAGAVLAARRTAWSDRKKNELISKNPIFTGELLTTNQVGRLQVLFHDDSILMMAPDTQTRITEYLYSGENQGNISLELARGVTRIISGKVTEEGGMINVSTAQAEIGIRGTDVLIRSSMDGVLEVAVLQGFLGKPTTVLLPGQSPDSAVRLGHRQGVIISGRDINWMDRDQLNNFSQSNPNRDSGVNMADYSPPATPPAPIYPDGPGQPGGTNNPATPPAVPEQSLNNVTATYSGSFTGGANFGAGFGTVDGVSGSFTFAVKDINTSNPMLSSVNFYAEIRDNSSNTYICTATGSGNLAPVTNKNEFEIALGNPNITTDITLGGSSVASADSSARSAEGVLHWHIEGGLSGSYDADVSGSINANPVP